MSDHGQAPDNPQGAVTTPKMMLSQVGALAQLLVELFSSASRISAFARSYQGLEVLAKDLPGDNIPVTEMAMALAIRLQEQGLVDQGLFAELANRRPQQREKLQRAATSCGVLLKADLTKLRQSRKRKVRAAGGIGAACAGIIAAALWWHNAPVTTAPNVSDDVIMLDPNGLDPIVLTVVSRRQGKSWQVLLSKHRTGESAARAIFVATFLKGDKEAAIALEQDQFSLCQNGKCISKEIIGSSFQTTEPVAFGESTKASNVKNIPPPVAAPVYIERQLEERLQLIASTDQRPVPDKIPREEVEGFIHQTIKMCPEPRSEVIDFEIRLNDKMAISGIYFDNKTDQFTKRCVAAQLRVPPLAKTAFQTGCRRCKMHIQTSCFGPDDSCGIKIEAMDSQ